MNEPIYPDKTKTGLAALKPLTDAFFAEPERWVWEINFPCDGQGVYSKAWFPEVFVTWRYTPDSHIRLTPKPRRVWIGDQSYEAHEFNDLDSEIGCWLVDLTRDHVTDNLHNYADHVLHDAAKNYLLFRDPQSAKQCLDAYRNARRVE